MNKINVRVKEPVRIRYKQLAGGNRSIYLDTYMEGVRTYEFLRLYLIPETDSSAKARNERTMEVAQAIKALRLAELMRLRLDPMRSQLGGQMLVADYVTHYCATCSRYHRGKSYQQVALSMRSHLLEWLGEKARTMRMRDIDVDVCRGFAKFLREVTGKRGKQLSRMTVHSYFGAFRMMMQEAVSDRVVASDPTSRLKKGELPPRLSVAREYLDADEVALLAASDCRCKETKRAFMFSCFTGLRVSDIRALHWDNIQRVNDGWRFSIVMKKTLDPITCKLSEEAVRWMNEAEGDSDNHVFKLPSVSAVERIIADWTKKAGITKHVTFHTARHTYATMALMAGADLYTIQKLLGHRNISTTTIYTAMIDERRDAATDNVSRFYQQRQATLSVPQPATETDI